MNVTSNDPQVCPIRVPDASSESGRVWRSMRSSFWVLLGCIPACMSSHDPFSAAAGDPAISVHRVGPQNVPMAVIGRGDARDRERQVQIAERHLAAMAKSFGKAPPSGLRIVYIESGFRSRWFPLSENIEAVYTEGNRTVYIAGEPDEDLRPRVLRHELAHAFLHDRGVAAPTWANEGFAMTFEAPQGRRPIHLAIAVARLTRQGRHASIREILELERRDTSGDVGKKYAGAWALFEALRESWGVDRLEAVTRLSRADATRGVDLEGVFAGFCRKSVRLGTERLVRDRGGMDQIPGWELDPETFETLCHSSYRVLTLFELSLHRVRVSRHVTKRQLSQLYGAVVLCGDFGHDSQVLLQRMCGELDVRHAGSILDAARRAVARRGDPVWFAAKRSAEVPWHLADRRGLLDATSADDPPIALRIPESEIPRPSSGELARRRLRMLPRTTRERCLMGWASAEPSSLPLVGAIVDLEEQSYLDCCYDMFPRGRPVPRTLRRTALDWIEQRGAISDEDACLLLGCERFPAQPCRREHTRRSVRNAIWVATGRQI